jgi:hypothetical protein
MANVRAAIAGDCLSRFYDSAGLLPGAVSDRDRGEPGRPAPAIGTIEPSQLGRPEVMVGGTNAIVRGMASAVARRLVAVLGG